jgi:hypothetical protein
MKRLLPALILLLSGCGSGEPPPLSGPITTATSDASPSPSAQVSVLGSHGGVTVTARPATSSQPGGAPYRPPTPAAPGRNYDRAPVGDLARGLLRPAPYAKVAVEFDIAGGAAPSAAARARVLAVVKETTRKPVTDVGGRTLPSRGNGCWKAQELFDLAAGGRRVATGGDTVSLDFLFLDGTSCAGSGVLGMAFSASAVAIFTGQVNSLATPTVPADAFMQAVTTHEYGHLLGMVNIGYTSSIKHEDAAHPGHSSNKQSVMYFAIDQTDLLAQFVNGPPVNFDSNDLADMQGLRDGTY